MTSWQGDNPFFLYVHSMEDMVSIDLDEPGWKEHYSELLSGPGYWSLVKKEDGEPVLEAWHDDGDTLHYVSRVFVYPHFGNRKLRAYGFVRDGDEVFYAPWIDTCTFGTGLNLLADRFAYASWGQVQLSAP